MGQVRVKKERAKDKLSYLQKMGAVSMEDVKILRAKTSAGISLCKEALEACDGDMQKASSYINERSDVISRLHDLTGAKIGLCKIAFTDAEQNFEKAVGIIMERGWNDEVSKDAKPEVKEGIIEAYVHGTDKKTVSLVEVTCQTDFVAKNDMFKTFAHEIAMQVAATKPAYVSEKDIPEEKLNEFKALFAREAEAEGKPANILPKIIEGKMSKYLQDNCLLNQKWFKDESKTIQNLLDENVATIGENITIRRMLVWKFGE